jgi:2-polyprenyl-6-methoxyphenol hydroxylase-like FAD-dependent oxidoreductase
MSSKIIVLGGGVCGLAAGLMLARDGHRVTVLERDPARAPATPEEAWVEWPRDGVAQFRQAHYLQPRGRHVLDAELPDVRDALLAAGAKWVDLLRSMPPGIADREPRPGDERLPTLTARRPALEQVLARAADAEPGLVVRRGVAATRLEARVATGGVHVAGVWTDGGERIPADLVVDAMGRRSRLPALVRAAGGDVGEEAEDSGFIYYTRFFRSADGSTPAPRASFLTPFPAFSVLTLPADSGTWSVTLYAAAGDQPLKQFRHPAVFDAVVRACPRHAHWLDGEPMTDVMAMGGVVDRCRRVGGEGRPMVTGLALLGDAWACTNPSLGRGMALGLLHAALLRAVVREHGRDHAAFAAAWDEATERELAPWYRATVAIDRARLAQIEAARRGEAPPVPDQPAARVAAALPAAMTVDADVFRAGLEIAGCLTLAADVFARPGLAQRVLAAAGPGAANLPPGPGREELLGIVSAAAGAPAAAR